MKTNNCIEDGIDSWKEQYIDNSHIDQKLVNDLINENFEFIQADRVYCLVAIRYIIFRVLEQYFATTMHKQKNDRNILIHCK